MDYPLLDFSIKFANLAVSVGVGLYVWLSNRNRVTHARITELQEKTSRSVKELKDEFSRDIKGMENEVDTRLGGLDQQLARLEEALKAAPDREELRQIHVRINEVSAQVTRLEGEFAGANHTLKLIHEYLLKGGGK